MKKNSFLFLAFLSVIGSSSYMLQYSTGIAGYTGSPGESTCTSCHNGGSSASTGVTITSVPSFTLDQYEGGKTYTISVTVGAAGYSHFGFGCEILDSVDANAGTMQLITGAGVKFLNSGIRRNATHTTPKTGTDEATFKFKWVAPQLDKATIYVCGNAVNGNGNTFGDIPIPTSMALTRYVEPVDTTIIIDSNLTRINKYPEKAIAFKVYPNPASGISMISYELHSHSNVKAVLVDLSGREIKMLFSEDQDAGPHSQFINLFNVKEGAYFVQTFVNGQRVAQKLLTIQ